MCRDSALSHCRGPAACWVGGGQSPEAGVDSGSSGSGEEKGTSPTEIKSWVQRGGIDCGGSIRLWSLVWSSEH